MWTRIVWVTLCTVGLNITNAVPAHAQKPAGVGPNLHRSHMIRRAQQRAAQGRPVTKHVGIWVAGGYESTVFGRGNPYLRNRGNGYAPRASAPSGQFVSPTLPPPVLDRTLWEQFPDAASYGNPFSPDADARQLPSWISSLQTTRPLTDAPREDAQDRQFHDRVTSVETAFRTRHLDDMLSGLQLLGHDFSNRPETYQLAALERFQIQDYATAAALAHTALSSGKVWNWRRLRMLYDKAETYTAQLRDLEQRTAEFPRQPELRFLLGYHYLMLGHDAAAADQFRLVSESLPQDRLTALILEKLPHAAPQ